MRDRRSETRLLCADLVEVQWRTKNGRKHSIVANLEDISSSGACLQLDEPVPVYSIVKITYPTGNFEGTVRYCVYREIGYFVGIQFEPGYRWSQKEFEPQHLLDPRVLDTDPAEEQREMATLLPQAS
jgi:hypothetical protein